MLIIRYLPLFSYLFDTITWIHLILTVLRIFSILSWVSQMFWVIICLWDSPTLVSCIVFQSSKTFTFLLEINSTAAEWAHGKGLGGSGGFLAKIARTWIRFSGGLNRSITFLHRYEFGEKLKRLPKEIPKSPNVSPSALFAEKTRRVRLRLMFEVGEGFRILRSHCHRDRICQHPSGRLLSGS